MRFSIVSTNVKSVEELETDDHGQPGDGGLPYGEGSSCTQTQISLSRQG